MNLSAARILSWSNECLPSTGGVGEAIEGFFENIEEVKKSTHEGSPYRHSSPSRGHGDEPPKQARPAGE